jgi:cysteinyl-tRNA synthetase
MADEGDLGGARDLAGAINMLFGALGLALHRSSDSFDSASSNLVEARDRARAQKDWPEADRLRGELVALGWIVEDSATRTLIRRP